jgi:anti-sigma-K factor RskA
MIDLEKQERLFDLLADRALFELAAEEEKELEGLLEIFPEHREDDSFSLTAAAITLAGLETREEMPESLKGRIVSNASEYFEAVEEEAARPALTEARSNVIEFKPKRFNWNWLGWAAAAAACIALVINIWMTRGTQQQELVIVPPVLEEKLTMPQMRQRLMDTSPDMTKATWTSGNVAEMNEIGGDVVWSDAKQAGYMRLKGLPANDGTKETYQLWIFDETQDAKTPIDGGVFNVNANGEVIIPITAKLKAKNPKMFAITVEKPGGVVVSDRKKIAALAKVEA